MGMSIFFYFLDSICGRRVMIIFIFELAIAVLIEEGKILWSIFLCDFSYVSVGSEYCLDLERLGCGIIFFMLERILVFSFKVLVG